MHRLARVLLAFVLAFTMGGFGPALNASAAGRPVDLEGRLEVIHADYFAGNKTDTRYNFITDQG